MNDMSHERFIKILMITIKRNLQTCLQNVNKLKNQGLYKTLKV